MKTTRTYTMTARARAVEATRASIVDAVLVLGSERLLRDIPLEDIADRAGVSVQTVLRQFGNRTGLFDAATQYLQGTVVEERRTPVGDVSAAVRVIEEHYELRGPQVLLLLAQEEHEEIAERVTQQGRKLHRDWVEEVFAPFLDRDGADRDGAVDLLVVATDVYTWKLLRRDRGLSRPRTRQQMEYLVRAVLTSLGDRSEGG